MILKQVLPTTVNFISHFPISCTQSKLQKLVSISSFSSFHLSNSDQNTRLSGHFQETSVSWNVCVYICILGHFPLILPTIQSSVLPFITQLECQQLSLMLSSHASRLLFSASSLNILNIPNDNQLNWHTNFNSTAKREKEESAIPLTLSCSWEPPPSVKCHICILRTLSSDLLLW